MNIQHRRDKAMHGTCKCSECSALKVKAQQWRVSTRSFEAQRGTPFLLVTPDAFDEMLAAFHLYMTTSYKQTREQYIHDRIVAATCHLKTLAACPKCKQSPPGNNVTGKRQTAAMDIDLIYCQHPYHYTQYDDGSNEMMALGLPNHTNFDKDWIKEMQQATYAYGLAIA